MHSSRMRTAHSLTIFRSIQGGGSTQATLDADPPDPDPPGRSPIDADPAGCRPLPPRTE